MSSNESWISMEQTLTDVETLWMEQKMRWFLKFNFVQIFYVNDWYFS